MIVSLNEIAATAVKAVSGSGYAPGIAEDMGFATRWLCERGLRGAEKLLHALERRRAAVGEPQLRWRENTLHISARDEKPLDAFSLATSGADLMLAHRASQTTIVITHLDHPLLILPFMARIGAQWGPLTLQWTTIDASTVTAVCDSHGAQINAESPLSLIQSRGDAVTLGWGALSTKLPLIYSPEGLDSECRRSIDQGFELADRVWDALQALAHNTYVPVSDVSRLSGAGAGLTDND